MLALVLDAFVSTSRLRLGSLVPVTAGSSKRIGTGDRKDRKATEPGKPLSKS